ncbi:hypothetical protein QCE63_31130 [Caballeronia sp. LZ065]|uniref:hypothetical protein n=1 Tax=Caballeronia sp. LZ065 TaxID=3038571 RepID=UPI00285C6B0A|nr:hypothetical protein [Caballeronia sp. LZ065]MDR5783875.1 hypothetical protein [Caballeronia sp. LZ065]
MIKIERNALGLAQVAGGARKQSTTTTIIEVPTVPSSTTAPATGITGSSSSAIFVNGKEVSSQSITF